MSHNDSGGLPGQEPATYETIPTSQEETARQRDPSAAAVRRRSHAALRLAPLPWKMSGCGSGLVARDPIVPEARPAPRTYGLTPRELRAEARRLRRSGWTDHEVGTVLDLTGSGTAP